MKITERKKLVEKIFSSKEVFERYVLDVNSEDDRIEVISILAKTIIRYALKNELNFLYMKSLEHFKFSLVVNLLFYEIANEWVLYAYEELGYSKEISADIIQEKENVTFLISLVKGYFKEYKTYFAKEIADTFMELIETMPNPNYSNTLIESVLKSGFVRKNKIAVIYNYGQLWSRIRHAHEFKSDKLAKIQTKIDEALTEEERKKYEYQEALLEEKPLAFYDEAILRLRDTMVEYIISKH